MNEAEILLIHGERSVDRISRMDVLMEDNQFDLELDMYLSIDNS